MFQNGGSWFRPLGLADYGDTILLENLRKYCNESPTKRYREFNFGGTGSSYSL